MIEQHAARLRRRRMEAGIGQACQSGEDICGCLRIRQWRRVPDERIDLGQVLFELRPARESVRTRRDQLRVGERETANRVAGTRMELRHLRDGISLAGQDQVVQSFGVFPKMVEGRIVRERTRWHSDLLARVERADGLWSAASGEEAACLYSCQTFGWAWPFPRTGSAPRA